MHVLTQVLKSSQVLQAGGWVLLSLLTAYLVLCVAVFWGQSRLIFAPRQQLEATPADYQVEFQEVWIPVPHTPIPGQSQQRLHAWWLPHPTSQQVLLYCHGKNANIGRNIEQALLLRSLGLSVLLFDYRGYGRSRGRFPHERQVYADATAAWHYLLTVQGLQPQQIFVYGHSIGGAIGIELASRQPQVAGLIVQGTFTSLPAMAAWKGWSRVLPLWLLRQSFDSLSRVQQLQLPVLYLHGTADTLVPATMSQELFAATASPDKWLALFPEAAHNDVAKVAGEAYRLEITRFIKRCLSTAMRLQP